MEGFCRGCLIKYDEPTDLVQYTEKNRRLYVYSTGLQVKRNDAFPFQLCKECYVNMKQACKFKKQCRTADKRYKNYLGLKESGEVNDFCTFLKNNDDSLMFRFPLRSGNSTPAYQKSRDDDEESTCTSIRNFMTDIIHADEIPDTEARIIREVIEEEADVMEDSLDSIWLQDDASIDTDFRLDFSFSPFTTPKSVNSDRCNTPQKLRELVKSVKIIGKKENTSTIQTVNSDQNKVSEEVEECTETYITNSIISKKEILNQNIDEIDMAVKTIEQNYVRQQNFYVEIENNEDHEENNVIQIEGNKDFTIENNLAVALIDTNKEFLLEDILKSPQICPGASGLSTPTINNLLFSEKIDDNPMSGASTPTINKILFDNKLDENGGSTPKPGHYIEKYEVLDGDILDDFFEDHNKSFDLYNVVNDENKPFTENEENISINDPDVAKKDDGPKYDLANAICITCDKKFKDPRYLKVHVNKMHNIRLQTAPKKRRRKIRICDICGKSYNDYSNLVQHIKSHETKGMPTCKICKLRFTSLSKLHTHKKTHVDPESRKKLEALRVHKHICTICGVGVATLTNLKIHLQRHDKNFACFCNECGLGFYRNHDLKVHMRTHNDDRPFKCDKCGKKFSRSDTLNRHMKIHNDERPYLCKVCHKRFTRPSALTHHIKHSLLCLRTRLHDEIIKKDKKDKKRNKPATYYCIVDDDEPKLVIEEGNQEASPLLAEADEDTLI